VRLSKLDEIVKLKIEHELSRIDKQLSDVSPLLDLCKIGEANFRSKRIIE